MANPRALTGYEYLLIALGVAVVLGLVYLLV
jgi:hypothetical protein